MAADDEPAETAAYSLEPTETGQQQQPTTRPGARQPETGQPGEATEPAPTEDDPTPEVIPGIVLDNRYRLGELLGRGATAEVYRASDELLGRSVAVKVFHRGIGDATTVARQRTEMQVLAKLHHPHLVTVYDAKLGVDHGRDPGGSDDDDLTYLVMELVQGGTLADRITPTGMSPADVARVGAAVAGALAAVHSYGLVHRDIKPANILISTSGEVKLSDFGIARELEAERLTAAADVIGTAAYLSPEQARGAQVGPATDVYALGLVLLESLTGHREYPGTAVESAVARLLRDPVVPATLPGSWPTLLRAMTQSDPARRPTSAEVEAALTGRADVVAAPPATATLPQPVPVLPPPQPSTARKTPSAGRTFLVTLLVLAVTAGVIVGIVALLQQNGNTPPAVTPPATSGAAPSVITTTQVTTEISTAVTTAETTPTTPTTPTTAETTPTTPTTEPTTPSTPTTPTTATTPTTTEEPPITPTSAAEATAAPAPGGTGADAGSAPAGG